MQRYVATYWNGTTWADLHIEPLDFDNAQQQMRTALLEGRDNTRLRLAAPLRQYSTAASF